MTRVSQLAPMVPVAVHVKMGNDGEEISRTEVESSLSCIDIAAFSKKLVPIRIYDEPVMLCFIYTISRRCIVTFGRTLRGLM